MSRFSAVPRGTAGQVLCLPDKEFRLGLTQSKLLLLSGSHALCRALPACRHAVGTIS
jgi:hypothetical protein